MNNHIELALEFTFWQYQEILKQWLNNAYDLIEEVAQQPKLRTEKIIQN